MITIRTYSPRNVCIDVEETILPDAFKRLLEGDLGSEEKQAIGFFDESGPDKEVFRGGVPDEDHGIILKSCCNRTIVYTGPGQEIIHLLKLVYGLEGLSEKVGSVLATDCFSPLSVFIGCDPISDAPFECIEDVYALVLGVNRWQTKKLTPYNLLEVTMMAMATGNPCLKHGVVQAKQMLQRVLGQIA